MRATAVIVILLLLAAVGVSSEAQQWRLGVFASADGVRCASGPHSFGVGDSLRMWAPPHLTETVATALYFSDGQLRDREVSAYVAPSGGIAKSWTLYAFGDTGYSPGEIILGFRTISDVCLPPPLLDGIPWFVRVTMLNNRGISGAPANGTVIGEFSPPTQHASGSCFYSLDPLPAVQITSRENILNEAYVLQIEQMVAEERSIGDWKSMGDGSIGRLPDAEVTVDTGDSFYVENSDRTSGLRVEKLTAGAIAPGSRAHVVGTIRTNPDGERFIDASLIETSAGSRTILPLGTIGRDLGGGNWQYDASTGAGQVCSDSGIGLNNTGLLVTVWGKPALMESPSVFAIEDGSGRSVVVVLPQGEAHTWAAGSVPGYVTVTGASGLKKIGDTIVPAIYIGSFAEDVRAVLQ